jgi:hypothetical protein
VRHAGTTNFTLDEIDQLQAAFSAFGACEHVVDRLYVCFTYQSVQQAVQAHRHLDGASIALANGGSKRLEARYCVPRHQQVRTTEG